MARETLASLTRRPALAGHTALVTGASGAWPAERVRDTVLTVIAAAAADRAPRDVACTAAGLRERHSGHPLDDSTPEKRTAKEHRP